MDVAIVKITDPGPPPGGMLVAQNLVRDMWVDLDQ
jgi:hypothetical protein